MTPDLLTHLFDNILACACAALDDFTVCGCPCRRFISVGEPAADSCCDDGQLSVHLDRIYAAGNFPAAANASIICNTPLAAEFTVRLYRCQPTVDDAGNPPSGPALQKAAEDLLQDLYVLTNALICCLAPNAKRQPFSLISANTLGPSGGCAAVNIRMAVQLIDPPIV